MCVTCGCGATDGGTLTLHDIEHEHVHADGTRHTHGHGIDHDHDHDHGHGHNHNSHHGQEQHHGHGNDLDHYHRHSPNAAHARTLGFAAVPFRQQAWATSHTTSVEHASPVYGSSPLNASLPMHASSPSPSFSFSPLPLPSSSSSSSSEFALSVPGRDARTIQLETQILGKNQAIADRNRRWLDEHHILALNLVSSPGAGKTTLLERTLTELKSELSICVVEGDQETSNDAERIRATGVKAVQVNTGTGCHLEADMLERAITALRPRDHSLLMIENVGNLVCPALFDLGERAKVVIFSVTEGEDKPLKYPHMFGAAEVLLLSKVDLLPHIRFDVEQAVKNALSVNPRLIVFRVSAYTGEGMEAWHGWLQRHLAKAGACASTAQSQAAQDRASAETSMRQAAPQNETEAPKPPVGHRTFPRKRPGADLFKKG